jgi:peptidoglycan/LPS O-acetylase OafA/YrhL
MQQSNLGARLAAGHTVGFDYLRISLALGVMLWHTFPLNYGRWAEAEAIRTGAALPVRMMLPLFFGLSGFLVASSLERLNALKPFLIFRALRIAPALVVEVVLSAFILGPLLTTLPLSQYFSDHRLPLYMANMLGWIHYQLPGVFEANPFPGAVNGSLWTVPYELECYALLAAAFLLRMFRLDVVLVGVLAVGLLAGLWFWPSDLYSRSVTVPGRALILTFAAGVLLSQWRDRVPTGPLWAIGALILSAILLSNGKLTAFSPLVLAYTAASLGCTNPRKSAILRKGDYSYGIYLYAFPMQQTAVHLLGGSRPVVTLLAAVAATTLFAIFSWHVIEKPTLKLKGYFASRPKAEAIISTAQGPVAAPSEHPAG